MDPKNDSKIDKADSEKIFAEGVIKMVGPLFTSYDEKMKNIQYSQSELSSRLSILTKRLKESQKEVSRLSIESYLSKLSSCKNDMQSISNNLLKITDRLHKLNKQAKSKYPELFLHYQKKKKEEAKRQNSPSKEIVKKEEGILDESARKELEEDLKSENV